MKLFLGFYNRSVILTYLGAIASVSGMALAMLGNMKFAVLCLVFAGVADLFDGTVARLCKRTDEEKEFGIQIDSLADMVSFALFPVVISFALGNTAWYHFLISSLYVLAAITRLGYFNTVTAGEGNVKYYTGLPVTFASLIVVTAYLVGRIFGITKIIIPICLLITALLFVLNIKIAKPRGTLAYALLGLLAIAMGVAVAIIG